MTGDIFCQISNLSCLTIDNSKTFYQHLAPKYHNYYFTALAEVDQKISAFSKKLKQKLFDFPTPLEEQKKIIRFVLYLCLCYDYCF